MMTVDSFGVVPFRKQGSEWQVLLILHKQGNHWSFPKGKANPGETPLESARRELKEEVGLEIERCFTEIPVTEQYHFRYQQQRIHKIVHYFPALVHGTLLLQEAEIRDAEWLSFNEALGRLSFKEARHVLRESVRLAGL
jgi:8-oxo-dGTP pyrophosphatase MutT (NUDIX family)